MALMIVLLFGIGNFTLHRAVLESRHPLLGRVPRLGGGFSLSVEFAFLLGTLLLVSGGSSGWAWCYVAYTGVNAISAWLILTEKV